MLPGKKQKLFTSGRPIHYICHKYNFLILVLYKWMWLMSFTFESIKK